MENKIEEFESYSKDGNDYAFYYSHNDEIAWALHRPKLPRGQSGIGREVANLEGIKNKAEASEKLKDAVDKL